MTSDFVIRNAAPASSAKPSSRRTGGRTPVSTSASRNASAGPVLPARRDAAHTPASATAGPVQKAACSGQATGRMVNQEGAAPPSTSSCARCGAPQRPSAHPAAEASVPTTAASVSSSRRSWPGVAPAVRSRPNSRRRSATANANVDATTNTETNAVIPAAVPSSAFTVSSASASCSVAGSARRRASPVRTWARSPTTRRTSATGASTPTASGPPLPVACRPARVTEPSFRRSLRISLSTGCG